MGRIPVVELAGTPAERGRQHGEAFAGEIRRTYAQFITDMAGATILATDLSSLITAFASISVVQIHRRRVIYVCYSINYFFYFRFRIILVLPAS